ncbi:hypothetical protein C3404_26560 [Citrobacter freundii complex sp. CFNIH11]|nr:hypothetical protein CFA70_10775 [Citrobacter freundii]OYQ93177.1 hypothetical protein B9P86_25360 [Citrobacter freundii]POV57178.1 hypothetical protein C3404_26560 [Citrobacter freundii complex sp. CFNIH11]
MPEVRLNAARLHRKPVERFKQGRECHGSLNVSESRRERHRSFLAVIIGKLLGNGSYHKFTLTDRVVFWHKARNELDFFELVEITIDIKCAFSVLLKVW